jgi:hypothetical protein
VGTVAQYRRSKFFVKARFGTSAPAMRRRESDAKLRQRHADLHYGVAAIAPCQNAREMRA